MKEYKAFTFDIDGINLQNLDSMSRGEKTEYLKMLVRVLYELESLTNEQEIGLAKITSTLSNYELRPKQYHVTKEEVKKYRAKYEYNRAVYEENERKREKLEKKIEEIQALVEGKKNLDKRRVFKNVRVLANEKSVKLGTIEKNAGCQAGYMSRLEKLGNITDPSAEFIITAAKDLGVTIDFLVNGYADHISPTEEYLFKFLCRIRVNTLKSRLIWTKDSIDKLMLSNTNGLEKTEETTLLGKNGLTLLSQSGFKEYKSLLLSNETVRVVGECYKCRLNSTDADLYLIPCVSDISSEYVGEKFYEIYLIASGEIHPVICTVNVAEENKNVVDSLYDEIESMTSQITIDGTVRDIIDGYLEKN